MIPWQYPEFVTGTHRNDVVLWLENIAVTRNDKRGCFIGNCQ